MPFDRTNIYCVCKQPWTSVWGMRRLWAKADQRSTEIPGPKSWGLRASFNMKPQTGFVLMAPYPNWASSFHFLESPWAHVLQGECLWAHFILLNSDLCANLSHGRQLDYRVAEFLWRFASSPKRKMDFWRPTGISLLIASNKVRDSSRGQGWKSTRRHLCSCVSSKPHGVGGGRGNFH